MVMEKINAANDKALEIILNGQPSLVGIGKCLDVVPGMTEKLYYMQDHLLHGIRPVAPLEVMMGALIYEGLAEDEESATKLLESGEITLDPWHHHDGVGPMAGVASASMPVFIIKNETYGNYSYCTLNEGLGKVLRFGAYNKEVIDRLKWMERVLGPLLKEALELHGPMDLKTLIAQMLQMGDEGHNRNKSGTGMFIRAIAPHVAATSFDLQDKIDVLKFMDSNDHFVLNYHACM